MKNEVCIRVGGAAGDGVNSTGEIFARTCQRSGLHVLGFQGYPSLIRGGHTWFQVRTGDRKVTSLGDHLDALIALNQDTLEKHLDLIDPGGLVIFDEQKVKILPSARSDVKYLKMPLGQLASKHGRSPVMQNTVAVGALTRMVNLSFDVLAEAIRRDFGHKAAAVGEANVAAAREGYELAATLEQLPVKLKTGENRRYLMTGNQAICLGALAAGCKFFSAYPMTPASTILSWMAVNAPEHGVIVKQAEDEIAAINMAIGASHVGVRAMTATSGGGFSLMVEALGLAGMTETPLVIVESQRPGPSTGLPTKTEQGDLKMLLGASQGDFPRIILAPVSVEDCYYATVEAFNLAEQYQCPVIVASDLYLSEHMETVENLRTEVEIDRGALITSPPSNKQYLRYEFTETGVSPRAIPSQPGTMYVAASDEHAEDGTLISDVREDPVIRARIMEKRMRKLETALRDMKPPLTFGPEDADLTIVSWGSSQGPVREAVQILNQQGVKARSVEIRDIWPFRSKDMEKILASSKKLMIVEGNYTGQMAKLIRAETGIDFPYKFLKYNGDPIYPREIVAKAREVMS